ncbi:transposase family protein [Methylovulum psychrotolerans]|uniref:transposase family protein n=1 Tax=Methylovulum psychrotolerans TaxID=1704499 RepID=UPI001E2A8350|nr:transposase family protein [Methylovulum psychrotolerans]
MKPYAQLPTDNPEEYKRLVGLSKEDFQHLNSKLCVYIGEQKALSPLTRRGRKDSKLTTEDRLLLTLYYLRHYPTLINCNGQQKPDTFLGNLAVKFPLKFQRGFIAQCRMRTSAVIKSEIRWPAMLQYAQSTSLMMPSLFPIQKGKDDSSYQVCLGGLARRLRCGGFARR